MKKRTRVILWTSPLFLILIEIFIVFIGVGLFTPWRLVGKPSEDISKIIGVHQDKLYVSTDSGELFSLQIPGSSIGTHAVWNKEQEFPSGPQPPCLGFVCVVEGAPWTASPPLLIHIKQIYQFKVGGEGGTLIYKFALSKDGNIWYWVRGFGVDLVVPFYFILIIEVVVYLLAIVIGFLFFWGRK